MRRGLAIAWMCGALACALAGDVVRGQEASATPRELVLRRGMTAPAGTVVGVEAQGVRVRLEGTGEAVVSWDKVAEVKGAFAEAARAYREIAELAWRARVRVERGDLVLAEPLLEELLPRVAKDGGATAAVVSGGLLRCRLGRGAQASAVLPFLWLRVSGGAEGLATEVSRPGELPLIDPVTGLCPALPPIWMDVPGVQGLAASPEWGEILKAAEGTPSAAMVAWYAWSVKCETGGAASVPEASADAGVLLVSEIVLSRAGEAEERTRAREQLQGRLRRGVPTWQRAWILTALGRSLVREEDREQKLLGVATLLRVPAQVPGENPYLTGVALATAAETLAALGDASGAARLRDELASAFPGHPALDAAGLRRLKAGRATRSTTETQGAGAERPAMGGER